MKKTKRCISEIFVSACNIRKGDKGFQSFSDVELAKPCFIHIEIPRRETRGTFQIDKVFVIACCFEKWLLACAKQAEAATDEDMAPYQSAIVLMKLPEETEPENFNLHKEILPFSSVLCLGLKTGEIQVNPKSPFSKKACELFLDESKTFSLYEGGITRKKILYNPEIAKKLRKIIAQIISHYSPSTVE